MREPKFTYLEDVGIVSCIIEDKNKYYYGDAFCHDEDMQFFSKRTGEQIAASRAYLEYLKDIRDTIKTELKAFKHFYSCIKQHQNFNENEYSVRFLLRTIKKLEIELKEAQSAVIEERNNLKLFLDSKDKLYREVEKRRAEEK